MRGRRQVPVFFDPIAMSWQNDPERRSIHTSGVTDTVRRQAEVTNHEFGADDFKISTTILCSNYHYLLEISTILFILRYTNYFNIFWVTVIIADKIFICNHSSRGL